MSVAFSKITLNGSTLMDVTQDTVNEENLLFGETATKANGIRATGILTFPYTTPEMHGAVGDGTTDDSAAIIEAVQTGLPVYFNATSVYAISASIYPTTGGENAELHGCGCQIKTLSNLDYVFRLTNAKVIEGFKINLNSHNAQYGIYSSITSDILIEDIEIYGLADTSSTTTSHMIHVTGGGTATIQNINIHTCTKRGNGSAADDPGDFIGVYAEEYENAVVSNVRLKNNHNVDSSNNIIRENCDGILLVNDDTKSSAVIQNIYGFNFGSRVIKTKCPSVKISTVQAYSSGLDLASVIDVRDYVVSSTSYHPKGIITDCVLVNEYGTAADQSLIESSGDIQIASCYLDSGTHNFGILNRRNARISDCMMYHNGVQNIGITIDIDSVYFSGGVFCAEYSSSTGLTSTSIRNCELHFEQKYGINTNFFQRLYGKAFYSNNKLYGYARIYIGSTAGETRIENCEFFDSITGDIIDVYGGNLILKNITFHVASGTTGIRAIYLRASSVSCDADNVKVDSGFNYSFVGSGSLTCKNTDMNTVYANSMASCYFYPEYYTSLPSRAQNGFQCLLTTDGKLYKYQSGSWSAV